MPNVTCSDHPSLCAGSTLIQHCASVDGSSLSSVNASLGAINPFFGWSSFRARVSLPWLTATTICLANWMATLQQLNSEAVRLHTLPINSKGLSSLSICRIVALHYIRLRATSPATRLTEAVVLLDAAPARSIRPREDERIYLIIRLGALLFWQTLLMLEHGQLSTCLH